VTFIDPFPFIEQNGYSDTHYLAVTLIAQFIIIYIDLSVG